MNVEDLLELFFDEQSDTREATLSGARVERITQQLHTLAIVQVALGRIEDKLVDELQSFYRQCYLQESVSKETSSR
jgi:hypothetical protein